MSTTIIEQKQGNVKVVCRFRPLNQREKAMGATTVHDIYDQKTIGIRIENQQNNNNLGTKNQAPKFTFDKVFDCDSTQQQVYEYAASSVIDSVIEGFNGTIFAYGQTSSGKTHTMEGQIQQKLNNNSGIVPRMVKQVFDSISTASEHIQFRIKVSLVELYLQKLRDLIDPKKNDLKIRSDKKKGIFIEDLSQIYISSPEQVYQLIKLARQSRAIASTNMNERSSRSHMLFVMNISQNNTIDLSAKSGKLYLVDLAGSQKVGKTGAEGKVLDQAKKINVSLTALGKVINALTDGKSTHVPYRDSKLTRVLQQSLGGNSKTSLIVTCSPHPSNTAQTISTLRFGISAKKIKNNPKINKQLTVGQLQTLLQKAEKENAQKERLIANLKNYILVDLKQKAIPKFEDKNGDKQNFLNEEEEQGDLVSQLQRQLEMQRNLHMVQQQQMNSLKAKYDLLVNQKEDLQRENEESRIRQKDLLTEIDQFKAKSIQRENSTKCQSINKALDSSCLQDLKKLTNDQTIIDLVTSILITPDNASNKTQIQSNLNTASKQSNQKYQQLLQQYENEKSNRKKAEDFQTKYEKNMQKKLMQLENNITQLTHAYYDLVVVQQRWKVDNLFLKKTMDEKDITIHALNKKIRDLEDQNRELQDQKWDFDDQGPKQMKKNNISDELSDYDFQCSRDLSKLSQNTQHAPKVVKVLKGKGKS